MEDRLLVALSRRGSLRIGQFISNALDRCQVLDFDDGITTVMHDCFQGVPDREYVEACERYAESMS